MNDRERETIFRIAGGCPNCFPIIFQICLLPFNRKREMLEYCIKKGIVGTDLLCYYESCGQSPAKLYAKILHEIDGLMARPVIKKDLI